MLRLSSIKKLIGGLARTREDLTRRLSEVVRGGRLDEGRVEAMEEALIAADIGAATAQRVMEAVRQRARGAGEVGEKELREIVASELLSSLDTLGRPPQGSSAEAHVLTGGLEKGRLPRVILVVGVNGSGKTTTVAKLAHRFKQEGGSVMLAAADTFRAAAVEQLALWGERVGAPVVKHAYGSDPGAVVFDAARAAVGRNAHVLIVDTAGRLHTKTNLMQELMKIAKISAREIPGSPHEVLLVLDATTGQNGLSQAREFALAVPVTGLVLTKLDGTARGGIAVAIARDLKIPIRYVGVGESMDDLLDFDARAFVSSLLGEEGVVGALSGT